MRRTLSGILTALILTTAAPAAAPALPVQAAPYVKAGQASASVAVSKETVEFIKKGGRTYCLTSEGSQKTGWVQKSGKWYYVDKKDGHMLTGWLKLKERKFYLKGDGSMVQGPCWYNVSGKRYFFTANGHVRSAWEMIGGKWHYRNTEGVLVRNKWVLYSGKYYYLDASGSAATGTVRIDGQKYTFTSDGALKGSPVFRSGSQSFVNADKTDPAVYESDKKKSGETGTKKTSSKESETKPAASKDSDAKPAASTEKDKAPAKDTKTASSSKDKKTTASSKDKKTESASKTTTKKTAKKTTDITKVTGKLNDLPESKRKFVIRIANYVRKYAPKYGIKVYSPIIAQAIHESGWGESSLSAKYHNYFGLKCGTLWTGKSVNLSTKEEYSAGNLTTIRSNFRVYDNMEQGVKGYFEFIQLPRYSNLKGVTSPKQYLTNIKNDGYATGFLYVDHTMAIVDMYDLTQFDK